MTVNTNDTATDERAAAAAQKRRERAEVAAREAAEQKESQKQVVSTALLVVGGVLLLTGAWFLWKGGVPVTPSTNPYSRDIPSGIVNFNGLFIGQTAAVVGAIFLAAGSVIRIR